MQVRGAAGWSRVGVAAWGSTATALRLPSVPWGTPLPGDASEAVEAAIAATPAASTAAADMPWAACPSTLALRIPALRGGCGGDEYVSLEGQVAGASL